MALQIHQTEPRTTLDIDLAIPDRRSIPRAALAAAGFVETGRFPHSENWLGPESTPVQFTDDPALAACDRERLLNGAADPFAEAARRKAGGRRREGDEELQPVVGAKALRAF